MNGAPGFAPLGPAAWAKGSRVAVRRPHLGDGETVARWEARGVAPFRPGPPASEGVQVSPVGGPFLDLEDLKVGAVVVDERETE